MKKNLISALSCLLILLSSSNFLAQQWVEVSSPPANFRTDHSFGFALNGMGYLVAGTKSNGNVTDEFYQYDPATDAFTQLADFPGAPRGFGIGDTWDGKAYFGFGAGDNYLGDLWEYDPDAAEWTELASCPCSARIHPAMVAHNGKIFVGLGGGFNGDLKDWWIYDIATNTWTQGTDFPSLPRHHPYQFGIDNYIYVGFGHGGTNIFITWYRYDPDTDTWDQVASLPDQGRVAGTQFSWNGKGYALSGEGETHTAMNEGEFWSYDPVTDFWEQLPSHPETSRWAPASFVIDNEVYLFNGVVYGFGNPFHPTVSYKFNLSGEMTSADEVTDKTSFTISPNPVSDVLTIQSKNGVALPSGSLIMYDVLGNQVRNIETLTSNQIDVSNLSDGVYFIRMEGEEETVRVVVGE